MADDSVKKLLIKLGISTADWKTAVNDIKAKLNEVNTQARKDAEQMKATQKEQLDLTKQQIAEQKKVTAEARTMTAVDQAKAAWEKRNQEALRTKLQQRILETAELKKQQVEQQAAVKLEQEQLRLAQQRLRLSEQQVAAQARQTRRTTAEGGGGGIMGTLGKTAASMMGGGPLGMIAAGVAGGEVITRGLEMISEKLRELAKDMVNATGSAGQLREQFEKLAKREGVDPEEFINRLRVATRGLVEDNAQLIRVANQFMSGPLKLQPAAIERLLGVTVALARATARGPNSVETAMNALSRAALTGNTRMLAMVVGIDKAQLQMQGLGRGINATAKEQMQLAMITDAMMRKLAEVGTPMTTLKDLFSQVHMIEGAFNEDMAYSITHTKSFSKMIEDLSAWLMKATPIILDFARSIGERIGNAFQIVKPYALAYWDAIKGLADAMVSLASVIPRVISAVDLFTGSIDKADKKVSPLRRTLERLGQYLEILSYTWKTVANSVNFALDIMDAAVERSATKAKQAWTSLVDANQKARAEMLKGLADQKTMAEAPLETGNVELPAAGKTTLPTQNNAQLAREEAKVRLQIMMDRIKAEQSLEETRIADAKEANREIYESGLESLQDYLTKERALLAREHLLKLSEIEQERKAKLAELAEESKGMTYADTEGKKITVPGMDPGLRRLKEQQINEAAAAQRAAEGLRAEKAGFGPTKEELNDAIASYREYQNAINSINKQSVQERIKVLESEFTQGKVSIDDYMSQRKMLIEEEYELTVAGVEEKLKVVKKGGAEEAKLQVELIQAQIDREKQLTDLQLSEGEKRVKNLENNYNQAKKFLDVVTATAARGKGAGAAAEEEVAQQAMLSIVQQRLAQLQIQQAALNPAVHGFSEEWTQVQEQIAAATEEEQKLNQQLAAAKDIAAPLAGIFGQIGALFEKFGGPTSRGIASMLTNMQGAFGELSKFSTGMAEAGGGAGLFGGLKESFTGLFKPQTITTTTKATAQQIFDQGLQKSSGTMDRLSEVTTKAISQIMAMGDAAKYVADTISRRSTAAAPPEMTSSAGPEGQPVSGTKGTYQFGTPYVPETGTYMLHAGEAVVPSADLAEGMGAPGGEIAGVISGVTESLTQFKTYLQDTTKVPFAQSLQDFAKGMGTVMSGLMGVVQGITGGKTAGAGAVSGATSLGGFGMQIGSIAGPMGAMLGGGAGAALGGILGGIFGGKEERLQVDLNTIKNQMEGILESLHTGTISLSQAIADLRQERQSAIAMLSQNPKSGKGGGKGKKGQTGQLSQAQAAIQAIDQQIQQLVDEQKAILDQLHQSLEMLSQPIAFQTYLSSLDQIIQKYQEFASAAAGNAQEVANAQLFLNDSLQQYVQTLAVQLNQAQQQAIQDGLTLLNLEYQRQQIINQSAQQEYDILTQGVAVRQRTTAMTKGQEIGQLQYQRDMQLEQINEQISLQKYKVESETKIFGLATTRIGLETQLLAAQESAFDVQNKQTVALAQVLTDLQQGMASGTLMKTITSLFSGGALPTGTGLLYTLLQQLGLGGNVPAGVLAGPSGTTNLLGLVPQQYQSAASFLNSLDPNFLSDLESAMQTPPGSAQRQSLLSSIQQYASQGAAEGYDMSGLGGWIASGAQQSGNIGAAGGSPAPPTAPITQPPVTSPTRGGGRTGLNPIRKAADFISTAQPPISVGGATNTGTQRLTVESQLLSITNQRVKVEMNVISARQDQINMEMEYLSALQDTYSTIASGTASGSSRSGGFEAMLQKVYETRGRYGSGNFRRETP